MEQALDFTLLSASSYIDIIGTEKKNWLFMLEWMCSHPSRSPGDFSKQSCVIVINHECVSSLFDLCFCIVQFPREWTSHYQ